MIADPIRLLDCVMRADGAAGLIVTSRKRRKEMGIDNCVIPIGYGERTNFKGGENFVDPTRSGHEAAGGKALTQAGVSIRDIRSFHPRRLPDRHRHAARGFRLLPSRARELRSSAT